MFLKLIDHQTEPLATFCYNERVDHNQFRISNDGFMGTSRKRFCISESSSFRQPLATGTFCYVFFFFFLF